MGATEFDKKQNIDLQSLLKRVIAEEPDGWRRDIAQGWLNELKEMDGKWDDLMKKIDTMNQDRRMLRMGDGIQLSMAQRFDGMTRIIGDSAKIMFSEYL